jgi:hypothetical protein
MSNTKFLILIIVLIGVGFGVVYGPRFLDQQQADRDASSTCLMYRSMLKFAVDYAEMDAKTQAADAYGKAMDYLEEGKCTKIH